MTDTSTVRPTPVTLSWRAAAAVAVAWLLVGVVWAAQASLAAALSGQGRGFGASLVDAWIQVVPWIPMTLAVVALAERFPVRAPRRGRHLLVHLAAFPVVAWVANVLVVLGYWVTTGSYGGLLRLADRGAYWAAMRVHVMALVYLALAGGTHALMLWRDLRARELDLARKEGQLARARAEALAAQLRPHFLFNTLHTIGQMWRSGRAVEADALLDHLGSLFQRVQTTTRSLEVPLEEELSMVRDYLAIEEARFRDRLRVELTVAPEAAGLAVPPLILQPLVENAVRHGISARAAAGLIRVSAERVDGRLVLRVEDDGPGMGAGPARPGSGTGLRNTRERLEQMYPGAHRVALETPAAGGTRVVLEIPAREVVR